MNKPIANSKEMKMYCSAQTVAWISALAAIFLAAMLYFEIFKGTFVVALLCFSVLSLIGSICVVFKLINIMWPN